MIFREIMQFDGDYLGNFSYWLWHLPFVPYFNKLGRKKTKQLMDKQIKINSDGKIKI